MPIIPDSLAPTSGEILVNTYTVGLQYQPVVTVLADGSFVVLWNNGTLDTRFQVFTASGAEAGPEVVVNTNEPGLQFDGKIEALAGGGFVVTWLDTQGDSGTGSSGTQAIKAQVFSATGAKLGGEILVNTIVDNSQDSPQLTELSNGQFVIVWSSHDSATPGFGETFGQLFAADGSKIGSEFQVNTSTTNVQDDGRPAPIAGGGFIVTWRDWNTDDIHAQVFDATGTKSGGEIPVNTTTGGTQSNPRIAALDNGNVLIVWSDQSAGNYDLRGQILDPMGAKVGTEFLVDATTGGDQSGPQILAWTGGGFIIAWTDGTGSAGVARFQQFAADGSKIGAETQVGETASDWQSVWDLVALPDGGFAVGWQDQRNSGDDLSSWGVRLERFDALGQRVGGDMLVNVATAGYQAEPSLAINDDGRLLVVWTDESLGIGGAGGDTSNYAVKGRFFGILDSQTGTDGGETLTGSGNDDSIDGRGGNDTLLGLDGNDALFGSAGDDWLDGGAQDDWLDGGDGADLLTAGAGSDTLAGGAGDDGLYFGAELDAMDVVDGGAGGDDQLGLQGNYGAPFVLGANNLVNIETLALMPGNDTRFGDSGTNFYDYNLTTVDANAAAGQVLKVNFNTLRAGEDVIFNGSAETDGSFLTFGGLGTDTLTGGAQSDGFYFGNNGRWGAGDAVTGGAGADDQLGLQGSYTVTFGAAQLTGIETIALLTGGDVRFGNPAGQGYAYDLTMHDGNVAAGQTLTVNANTLRADQPGVSDETLTFNGAAELDGKFTVYGGAADDVITGGAGNDKIYGAGGADTTTGGAGSDTFAYINAAHSTAAAQDHILDFASGDTIDLSAIDANTGLGGNDAFSFVGSAAFTNTAGELRAVSQGGSDWLIEGDIDGDSVADISILVTVSDLDPITAIDFAL